jgi:hypothetical protein
MNVVNPFSAVSRAEYEALAEALSDMQRQRDDAVRESSGLRIELQREIENASNLTTLCARAIKSAEILEQALIERQIGAKRDPSLVLVVGNLPEAPKRRHGFIPLNKRRREAAKRQEAAELRRSALPKLTAELPAIPLTQKDREVMREALEDLNKETV